MTDPGSSPPPPPPPTGLAPPPGYAAYSNAPTMGPMRSIAGLRKAIVILLAVLVVGTIISIATAPATKDVADDFLAGRIDEDQFNDDLAAYMLPGGITGLAQLAIVVLTIIWLYRIVSNHRTLGRRLTWAPGWAIGGWFLPPFLFIIPLLVLRESWKAADPDVPVGSDEWRRRPVDPVLWVWWVLFGLAPIAFAVLGSIPVQTIVGGDVEDRAEQYSDGMGIAIGNNITTILGAVAFAVLVMRWTSRHTRLTGEADRRP